MYGVARPFFATIFYIGMGKGCGEVMYSLVEGLSSVVLVRKCCFSLAIVLV